MHGEKKYQIKCDLIGFKNNRLNTDAKNAREHLPSQ